jgi:hypothetical protein
MTRHYLIKFLLETSDHDGYCSDNECNYNVVEQEHIIYNVSVPDDLPDGELYYDDTQEQYFISLLPKLHLWESTNTFKSGYCSISPKCKNNNLCHHDYRYNIKSVSVITK